jgi:hypothetical protein
MDRVRRCREPTVSGYKYKMASLVDYLGRERASGVYQITQLLTPEGEAFQYRIKRQRTSRTRSQRKRTS